MDQAILKYIPALFSAALVACGGGSDSTAAFGSGSNSTTSAPLSSSEGGNPSPGNPSNPGTSGFVHDASARFSALSSLTADSSGNLYALDAGKIRKIAASGDVTTLPGALNAPRGLQFNDFYGTFFTLENDAVRQVAPDGTVSTLAMLPQGARAITLDAAGYVQALVAQSDFASIFRVSPEGVLSTTYSGAPLSPSNSLAIAAAKVGGTLYVGDRGGTIHQFPTGQAGSEYVTVAAGEVQDMALDLSGNLYISEARYSYPSPGYCSSTGDCAPRLVYAGIYKVAPDRTFTTLIQTNELGVARIAVGSDGNLYAAFSGVHAIYKVLGSSELELVAGTPGEAGSSD